MELVDDPFEGSFGPTRGRRASRVNWQVRRSLRIPEDLPLLHAPSRHKPASIARVRYTHHQLARLLATGVRDQEASLITGYQPAYISIIKGDPAFQDLMAYYAEQRDQIYTDVVERMRSLGLATIDELQARLEEEPEGWSRRELMELAELMLVKPAMVRGGAPHGTGGGISVNVKFVTAEPKSEPRQAEHRMAPDPVVIDAEVIKD